MDACNAIMKKQFTRLSGFNSVDLGQPGMNRIGYDRVIGEAIQMHHTQKSHWITSSCIGGKVCVYDSLGSDLSDAIVTELCELYPVAADDVGILEVNLICSQKQSNGNICGLFAIANAVELAINGTRNMTAVQYDENKMRLHVQGCLENGRFSSFPKLSVFAKMQASPIRVVYLDIHSKATSNRNRQFEEETKHTTVDEAINEHNNQTKKINENTKHKTKTKMKPQIKTKTKP